MKSSYFLLPFAAILISLGLAGAPSAQNPPEEAKKEVILRKPTQAAPKAKVTASGSLELIVAERVEPYTVAEVTVKTSAKFLSVKAQASLFEGVKVYELIAPAEGERRFVFTGKPSKFLVTVTAFDPETGIREESRVVTIGVPTPEPPAPPNPPTPPTPPGPTPPGPQPVPIPGVARVLIIEETHSSTKKEYQPYLNVLNSLEIKQYLNKKVKNNWRVFDKDFTSEQLKNEEQIWQDVFLNKDGKYARTSPTSSDITPWIYITNGKEGYSGPIPSTIPDTLVLLKKYLGE
jgi:hypothetical protein